MREEFLYAAELFLQCDMRVEACKCLVNAKEFVHAAQLYEKLGQVHSLDILIYLTLL